MAEHVFMNGLLLCGRADLTAFTKEVRLLLSNDLQGTPALNDTWQTRLAGLSDVAFSGGGYFSAAEPDATLFAELGVVDSLITAAPTIVLGDVSYFFRAALGEYTPIQGAVGEVAGFVLNAASYSGALIRGTLMENGSVLVTGNGTGRNLGAVGAAQSVYAGLHITAITGDWTIIVESDDNSGFTTPTTRMTFSNQTAIGDLFSSLAGSITDTWWRYRFTENSAGTITLAASLGIK